MEKFKITNTNNHKEENREKISNENKWGEKGKKINRRDALKIIGGLLASAGVGIYLGEKMISELEEDHKEDANKWKKIIEEIQERIASSEKFLKEVQQYREDLISNQEVENKKTGKKQRLAEALSLDYEDEIIIDLNLIDKIKQSFIKDHDRGGIREKDLLNGIERMQPLFKELIKPFLRKKHKHYILEEKKPRRFTADPQILKKYVYLALAESYFVPEAKSPAGAVGAYQFMYKTAKKALLNPKHRKDPIKSASGCANHITYLLNDCNHDEKLALSGYNGGFIWNYFRKEKDKKNRSYENFIIFMNDYVNNKKKYYQNKIKECKNWNTVNYTVREGDTLYSIAKTFGITVDKIRKINNLNKEETSIDIGQKFKLPATDKFKKKYIEDIKRKYNEKINPKSLAENLEYPAKFEAIMEVINKLKRKGEFVKEVDIENYPV